MRGRILVAASVLIAVWTATVNTASPVRVHVTFHAPPTISPSVLVSVLREAGEIWAPYGIAIDADQTNVGEAINLALVVVFDMTRSAGDSDSGLADLQFAADGIPHSTITVYYRALTQMVANSETAGADASQWPAALREQSVARALGRTLAHELGHFVLRSPHHAESGLMRPRQYISALTDSSRKAFTLTGVERARLQIVVDAQARALPTLAGGDAALAVHLAVPLATASRPE